jgi:uncharacterized protein YjcR
MRGTYRKATLEFAAFCRARVSIGGRMPESSQRVVVEGVIVKIVPNTVSTVVATINTKSGDDVMIIVQVIAHRS